MKLSDLRRDFGDWEIKINLPFAGTIGPAKVSSFRDEILDSDITKVEWDRNIPTCFLSIFTFDDIKYGIAVNNQVRFERGGETLYRGYSGNVPSSISDMFISYIETGHSNDTSYFVIHLKD